MEAEPKYPIIVNGKEIDLVRENTHLYHHLGALAMYDCVRIEDKQSVFHLFEQINPDIYEEVAEYMSETGYPASINQIKVTPSNKLAHDMAVERMVKKMTENLDGVPEDW